MDVSLNDLYAFRNEEAEGKPFIFVSRDRAFKDSERWVFVSLSTEEVKQVYEYLSNYFK